MKSDSRSFLSIDRKRYASQMAKSLPVLRAKLGISQTELAEMIGVTRQTISSAERGERELAWNNFISLLYIFTQDEETVPLLAALEITTPELGSLFRTTNLDRLSGLDKKAKPLE